MTVFTRVLRVGEKLVVQIILGLGLEREDDINVEFQSLPVS
jgi:hypothetical protein